MEESDRLTNGILPYASKGEIDNPKDRIGGLARVCTFFIPMIAKEFTRHSIAIQPVQTSRSKSCVSPSSGMEGGS